MNLYPLKEEVYLMLYLIAYGIYLFATLDIIEGCIKRIPKKWMKVILQILYWIAQCYITYLFSYRLLDGYLPIYFILFILVGYILYRYVFKKVFIKTLTMLFYVIKKICAFLKKVIQPFMYSKPVVQGIKKGWKHYKKIIKDTCSSFTKRKKKEKTSEKEEEIL